MKIVIAGAGKLGASLADTMISGEHEVHLIEIDKQKCTGLATKLDTPIVHGDCTDLLTLRRASIQSADVFIAVTGRDEDNLISCQLARTNFRVKKTISRANNPNNKRIMQRLGVDYVVCISDEICKLIELEAETDSSFLMASLNHGETGIYEIALSSTAKCAGVRIMDIDLPKGVLIISVIRGEESMIPDGSTILKGKDKLIILCKGTQMKKVHKILNIKPSVG